ncbi:hypothetical protein [Paenibacillus tengchongensis]|uniref:hypothetical protein n=1 Tax=Paenibacillus tengchongensis TaxID=2608684 RepID=UPI00124DC1AE|nr:hypothetical protein [Paenibacillus tengchongensis]
MEYNPPNPPKPQNPEYPPGPTVSGYGAGQLQESPYEYLERKQDLKHSGPGIASFVISMITFIGYIVAFLYAGMQAATILEVSDGSIAESSGFIMLLGVSVLVLLALNIIGGIIGIIGLTLRGRRKVFAVLGTIFNALFVLLFMLMVSAVLVNAGAS